MTKNKILSITVIAAIATILLAWAPSIAYAGNGGIYPGILDVKPGSCPNPVNLGSNGVVPMAILGSETLDVTTLGFNPNWNVHYEDVGTPFEGAFIDRHSCNEDGPDGFLDATFNIPAESFLVLCGIGDKSTAIVGVHILIDGQPTIVWDIVQVLNKNNSPCN